MTVTMFGGAHAEQAIDCDDSKHQEVPLDDKKGGAVVLHGEMGMFVRQERAHVFCL